MPLVSTPVRHALLGLLAVSLIVGCGANSSDPDALTPPANSPSSAELPESTPAPPPTTPAATNATPQSRPHTTETAAASVTVEAAATPLTPEALWAQLQQPGDTRYVVLLRHAIAPGTGDPANFQLDDCSTQRNLSDEGRSQAAQIGQAFRDRGVEVQQVLSSQWCRCLETAEQMALGTVEADPALNSFFRDRRTAEAQTTEVKQYLLSQAEQPGVTVMVTHQVNITGLTDIVPRSGEAVVLQVEETGLTQIGQFLPAASE